MPDRTGNDRIHLTVDAARALGEAAMRGAGFDENHDGRVDVFKKYGSDGKVIEETRDTDFDGRPPTSKL